MPKCSTGRDPNGRQQVRRDVARRAQLQARVRRPRQRPPADFHRGEHLCRFGAADAGDARQIVAGGSHQAVEAAAGRQQLVGGGQRARPPAAAAEHERDELVVAQRRGTVTHELLARPITSANSFIYYTRMNRCQLSALSYQLSASPR